jgi:hypothetical protein
MKTEFPPIPELQARLSGVELRNGAGSCVDDGMCAMQAVAWLGGEIKDGHLTDAPQCACRVVRPWVISANDNWSKMDRQKLLAIVPLLVGSRASLDVEVKRMYHFADFAIRTAVPFILEKAGWPDLAARLRAVERVTDNATAERAKPEVLSVRDVLRSGALARARALARALDRALDLDLALDLALALARARALDLDQYADLVIEAVKGALAITE